MQFDRSAIEPTPTRATSQFGNVAVWVDRLSLPQRGLGETVYLEILLTSLSL